MNRKQRIWQNFSRVLLAALTETLQLVTLGFGVVLSILFPELSLWILGLTFLTVGLRAVTLIVDKNFIQNVLSRSQKEQLNFLPSLIQKVNDRLKEVRFSSAVQQDLQEAREILGKLDRSWQTLSATQMAHHAPLIRDLLDKLIDKLISLSRQEESARKFIRQVDREELRKDLESLKKNLKHTEDKIAQNEYEKALKLKQDQQKSVQKIEQKIARIDSYHTRILAELENTHAYLGRLGLSQSSQTDYGQTDYLSADLQKLADDLDGFENEALEVGQEIRQYVDKDLKNEEVELR